MRYVVIAPMKVKVDCIDEFIKVADANARESRREKGVLLFDVIQNRENSGSFTLVEQYTAKEEHLKHRETEHFRIFKEKVAMLLEEPYKAEFYDAVSATL